MSYMKALDEGQSMDWFDEVGTHMIGADVAELLPELTLAQKWDLTAAELARKCTPIRLSAKHYRRDSTVSSAT
jgi:hypothetical protein